MKLIRQIRESISAGDALKVFGGVLAAVLFFVSPLKDWVLFKIWGEEFKYEFNNEQPFDPDRPFTAEVTIQPTTLMGISSGVLSWRIDTTNGESPPDDFTDHFEGFKEPRVFRKNVILKGRAKPDLKRASVTVKLETRYNVFKLGTLEYKFERTASRHTVGEANFTGMWTVHFMDKKPIANLLISEDASRKFSGSLVIPEDLIGVNEIPVSGKRDGQAVWFDEPVGTGIGAVLSNGTYGFEEGLAYWRGKLTICHPCEIESRQVLFESLVWIFAPHYQSAQSPETKP